MTLVVSEKLHEAIRKRAEREGRMIQVLTAQAFHQFLGSDFPKESQEAKWIPKSTKRQAK